MTRQELLSIVDVATLLRVNVRTVRRRLYNRRKDPDVFPLPVSGEGWESRWSKSDVEDYLKRRYARKFLPLTYDS